MSVHKLSLVFFSRTFNVLSVSPMWGAAGSAKPSLRSTGRVGMGGGWVGVTLWVIADQGLYTSVMPKLPKVSMGDQRLLNAL